MLFIPSFQIFADLLPKCYKEQLVGLWLGVKRFLRVSDMCFSHVWYNLYTDCVLYGNWVPDGYDDYIICTTNWFIQIPLDVKNWLVFKDFILKDTKLLS